MASWNQLLSELAQIQDSQAGATWIQRQQQEALARVSAHRGQRNVILYSSAFLQKPQVPPTALMITHEDVNGFMSSMHQMDCARGLTLVLHTPGGGLNATEAIVAYLHSKFNDIEVIVPTFAMSAGTMISLAANRIVMGRQSQLGPIDPQMSVGGRSVSARSVVDQFEQAKSDILGDVRTAHVWAPILTSLGPSLLQEAKYALEYGEQMVAKWLADRRFSFLTNPDERAASAKKAAAYFNNAAMHKSHGRRIDRAEARGVGIDVLDLEEDQEFQDAVLTLYHLVTIAFEKGPASKVIASQNGKSWVKNV